MQKVAETRWHDQRIRHLKNLKLKFEKKIRFNFFKTENEYEWT